MQKLLFWSTRVKNTQYTYWKLGISCKYTPSWWLHCFVVRLAVIWLIIHRALYCKHKLLNICRKQILRQTKCKIWCLLIVLFELHIIPLHSQTFPVILGLMINTRGTVLLDNVILIATVTIRVCTLQLMCCCFSTSKHLDFRNISQCMHACDTARRAALVLEQEMKSLKASEVICFFVVTV